MQTGSAEFPKLLVATEFPPNAAGGGPAVVRQMLAGWPADRLSWWSCSPDRDARFGQKVNMHRVAAIPAKLYPQTKLARLKALILERAWAPWAARHLRRATAEVQPEAIWVIPHQWSIPPLVSVIPKGGIGFHATIQDYVDAQNTVAKFGSARAQRMALQADRLYSTATTRDATSHPMIADLQMRTGREAAQMLHAGLEADDFAFLETKATQASPQLCVAHAGTIVIEEVFEHFAAALRQLRANFPRRIELHLFGAHSYARRAWFDPAWMQEHGNLEESELRLRLRTCDWGFAPMALTDDDPRYNRFSFPTKFITYLAAGLPVITLGHEESSVVKMARRYEVGLCSTTHLHGELVAQLAATLGEASPWKRYAAEILRCARTEFDAARMRTILWSSFSTCARSH